MKPDVKTLRRLGLAYLNRHGLDHQEAQDSSDFLLLEILSFQKRSDLFIYQTQLVTPSDRVRFWHLLRRRARREPLQYLIGKVEFHGLLFQVTPACLVPRPETAELVDYASAWMRAGWRGKISAPVRFLDIGTGSGIIAITLLHFFPDIQADALDISEETLHVARKNAEINNVLSRVQFQKSFLFDALIPERQYDFIVANLPYLSEQEFGAAQAELHFEPRHALVAGEKGSELLELLIKQAQEFLAPQGALFLEIGSTQGERVEKLLSAAGFQNIKIEKDKAGLDRVAIACMA